MAILTDSLKRQLLLNLESDFNQASTYYFLGIARSQIWNDSDIVPTAVNTQKATQDFRHNLQAVKQISDISAVVPRVNWSPGTTYAAYDDNVSGHPSTPYYVMTSALQVYVCIQPSRDLTGVVRPSTVEPTSTSSTPFTLADGYTWKFLYSLSALEQNRFLAANFIPVRFIDSSDGSLREDQQFSVQSAAADGEIGQIVITNGGTGYVSAPTVTINGDGSGATATAVISGGSVVRVEMTNRGSGYTRASVRFSTGNAAARAVLAPLGGFGADPRNDLRATALMLTARPDGTEGGEFLIDQEFRQIGIIKNIKQMADSDFTASAGNALHKILFDPGASGFVQDNLIVGGTSGARAYIDFVDSAVGVFFHQDSATGFISFQNGESLTSTNLAGTVVLGTGVLDSITNPTVNKYSGEVLYLDNRSAIVRSSGEIQDIKMVIQL